MEVGYVPDQFGHVGQPPQIFAGFGRAGAPLLEGCASARSPQQRADFRNDRLLTR